MKKDFLEQTGDTWRDFVLLNVVPIEELRCLFKEILHQPSGAKILHLENDDPENFFCLSFQTLPSSSNGAAHILEHTVLCGSKRFPVKDPFFSMTRRSLNTFMNAFTGADFTCYPASSQIEKDFYNLLDVYLDAVFQAKLERHSFLQEGWRLEFEKKEDPSTALLFKGIVYNEMKGSLASPDAKLWHTTLQTLFPDLPYAYNSGGDPKEIPLLSYEELLAFYQNFYHPSRCLFFFYGNLPLKQHLDFIEKRSLKDIIPLPPLPPLPKQPRLTHPSRSTLTYCVPEGEELKRRAIVSFGWLTCHLKEQEEVLALSILDSVLMDTDASPLKMALLSSKLCTQADSVVETEMSEVPYLIVCKGCDEETLDELEALLFKELTTLSQSPLPKQWIEAAAHQLELSRMEILGDHGPFGLTLFFRSGLAKQHGCNPEKNLQLLSLFNSLLSKIEDPLYLPGLIRRYFVDNMHRTRVVLLPDPSLGAKESEEERVVLQGIRKTLSKEDEANLVNTAIELEEIQEAIEHQDIECLPKVTLQDVPLLARDFPLHREKQGDWTLFHHSCFTNHLVYVDLVFDLPALQKEEIPYLQLLLTLLPELGAGNRDYKENLEYIHSHTGGISLASSLYTQVQDPTCYRPALLIRGKCLQRKIEPLLFLLRDTLSSPHLRETKRIEERIKHLHTSLQNRLSRNGLRYASQLALSGTSQAAFIANEASGLSYYQFVQRLMHEDLSSVIEKLIDLHSRLFSFHSPSLILSSDEAAKEKIASEILPLLSLPQKPFTPWTPSFTLPSIASQGRILPSQVAYNVQALSTVSYIHPHSPSLLVATHLLENKILHSKIREQGGAYGAGASYNPSSGSFTLHAYRDPHIKNTFSAFEEALHTIARGKFSEQDLEEAKLGVIQSTDLPVPPSERASLAYSFLREGKEKRLRQEYRDNLLSLDKKQIIKALEAEVLSKQAKAVRVSFAGQELLEKEAANLPLYPLTEPCS